MSRKIRSRTQYFTPKKNSHDFVAIFLFVKWHCIIVFFILYLTWIWKSYTAASSGLSCRIYFGKCDLIKPFLIMDIRCDSYVFVKCVDYTVFLCKKLYRKETMLYEEKV